MSLKGFETEDHGPSPTPHAVDAIFVDPVVNVAAFSKSSFTMQVAGLADPPNEVHVRFNEKPSPVIVFRFTDKHYFDQVLDTLSRYREEVWGKR